MLTMWPRRLVCGYESVSLRKYSQKHKTRCRKRFHFLQEEDCCGPPGACCPLHATSAASDGQRGEWHKNCFHRMNALVCHHSLEFFRWKAKKEITFKLQCRYTIISEVKLSTLYLTTSTNFTLIIQFNHRIPSSSMVLFCAVRLFTTIPGILKS